MFRNNSIPLLLMPWLLTSPGHQQPKYWLCRINESLPSTSKGCNYPQNLSFVITTQRTHDAIITPLLLQNYAVTSFSRNIDVINALCAHWEGLIDCPPPMPYLFTHYCIDNMISSTCYTTCYTLYKHVCILCLNLLEGSLTHLVHE